MEVTSGGNKSKREVITVKDIMANERSDRDRNDERW